MKINQKDINRIIAYKKKRLKDLSDPETWNGFIRYMECGEIRELKQSCIDDEIIIYALEALIQSKEVAKE